MARLFKRMFQILIALVVLAAVLWFWPRDSQLSPPRFDAASLPANPTAWLAGTEAKAAPITPGAEKQIHWAGQPGVKTPLAIVYLHGFTATLEETRPVPDRVAQALGANIFYTRMTGHGQGGEALNAATADDWITDLAEALAVGEKIGERILILSASTGGTLFTAGLGTPELRAALPATDKIAGVVMISPNFRLASTARNIATELPLAQHWLPVFIGQELRAEVRNPRHETFWTTRYPTTAVLSMAKMLRAARAADPGLIDTPLLMMRSPDDRIVSFAATEQVMRRWGGPVTRVEFPQSAGMDKDAHVIAGDIRSPGMTDTVVARILEWAKAQQL